MPIDLTPFYDGHGPEVFFLPGLIREPGIMPGHLYSAVSQELLNTLQPHAGIEQFAGAGMTQAMQSISLMGEARLFKTLYKNGPDRWIGDAVAVFTLGVKEISLMGVSNL